MLEFLNLAGIGLLKGFMPLIALMLVLSVLQRLIFTLTCQHFGYRTVIATGLIGTTLHELSHLIMCIVFRYKINEVSFYQPSSVDGTLGYVNFSYSPYSIYQRFGMFFVGLAPFYFGLFYVWATTYYLLQTNVLSVYSNSGQFAEGLIETSYLLFSVLDFSWKGVTWGILTIPVILHMMPSKADMRGARSGALILLCVYAFFTGVEYISSGDIRKTIEMLYGVSIVITGMLINLVVIMVSIYVLTVALVVIKKLFKLTLHFLPKILARE